MLTLLNPLDLGLSLFLSLPDLLNKVVGLLQDREQLFVFKVFFGSLFLCFMLILQAIYSLSAGNWAGR